MLSRNDSAAKKSNTSQIDLQKQQLQGGISISSNNTNLARFSRRNPGTIPNSSISLMNINNSYGQKSFNMSDTTSYNGNIQLNSISGLYSTSHQTTQGTNFGGFVHTNRKLFGSVNLTPSSSSFFTMNYTNNSLNLHNNDRLTNLAFKIDPASNPSKIQQQNTVFSISRVSLNNGKTLTTNQQHQQQQQQQAFPQNPSPQQFQQETSTLSYSQSTLNQNSTHSSAILKMSALMQYLWNKGYIKDAWESFIEYVNQIEGIPLDEILSDEMTGCSWEDTQSKEITALYNLSMKFSGHFLANQSTSNDILVKLLKVYQFATKIIERKKSNQNDQQKLLCSKYSCNLYQHLGVYSLRTHDYTLAMNYFELALDEINSRKISPTNALGSATNVAGSGTNAANSAGSNNNNNSTAVSTSTAIAIPIVQGIHSNITNSLEDIELNILSDDNNPNKEISQNNIKKDIQKSINLSPLRTIKQENTQQSQLKDMLSPMYQQSTYQGIEESVVLNNLAVIYGIIGELDKAEELLVKSVAQSERDIFQMIRSVQTQYLKKDNVFLQKLPVLIYGYLYCDAIRRHRIYKNQQSILIMQSTNTSNVKNISNQFLKNAYQLSRKFFGVDNLLTQKVDALRRRFAQNDWQIPDVLRAMFPFVINEEQLNPLRLFIEIKKASTGDGGREKKEQEQLKELNDNLINGMSNTNGLNKQTISMPQQGGFQGNSNENNERSKQIKSNNMGNTSNNNHCLGSTEEAYLEDKLDGVGSPQKKVNLSAGQFVIRSGRNKSMYQIKVNSNSQLQSSPVMITTLNKYTNSDNSKLQNTQSAVIPMDDSSLKSEVLQLKESITQLQLQMKQMRETDNHNNQAVNNTDIDVKEDYHNNDKEEDLLQYRKDPKKEKSSNQISLKEGIIISQDKSNNSTNRNNNGNNNGVAISVDGMVVGPGTKTSNSQSGSLDNNNQQKQGLQYGDVMKQSDNCATQHVPQQSYDQKSIKGRNINDGNQQSISNGQIKPSQQSNKQESSKQYSQIVQEQTSQQQSKSLILEQQQQQQVIPNNNNITIASPGKIPQLSASYSAGEKNDTLSDIQQSMAKLVDFKDKFDKQFNIISQQHPSLLVIAPLDSQKNTQTNNIKDDDNVNNKKAVAMTFGGSQESLNVAKDQPQMKFIQQPDLKETTYPMITSKTNKINHNIPSINIVSSSSPKKQSDNSNNISVSSTPEPALTSGVVQPKLAADNQLKLSYANSDNSHNKQAQTPTTPAAIDNNNQQPKNTVPLQSTNNTLSRKSEPHVILQPLSTSNVATPLITQIAPSATPPSLRNISPIAFRQSDNLLAIQKISELLSEGISGDSELILKKRITIKDSMESYILKCAIRSSKANNTTNSNSSSVVISSDFAGKEDQQIITMSVFLELLRYISYQDVLPSTSNLDSINSVIDICKYFILPFIGYEGITSAQTAPAKPIKLFPRAQGILNDYLKTQFLSSSVLVQLSQIEGTQFRLLISDSATGKKSLRVDIEYDDTSFNNLYSNTEKDEYNGKKLDDFTEATIESEASQLGKELVHRDVSQAGIERIQYNNNPSGFGKQQYFVQSVKINNYTAFTAHLQGLISELERIIYTFSRYNNLDMLSVSVSIDHHLRFRVYQGLKKTMLVVVSDVKNNAFDLNPVQINPTGQIQGSADIPVNITTKPQINTNKFTKSSGRNQQPVQVDQINPNGVKIQMFNCFESFSSSGQKIKEKGEVTLLDKEIKRMYGLDYESLSIENRLTIFALCSYHFNLRVIEKLSDATSAMKSASSSNSNNNIIRQPTVSGGECAFLVCGIDNYMYVLTCEVFGCKDTFLGVKITLYDSGSTHEQGVFLTTNHSSWLFQNEILQKKFLHFIVDALPLSQYFLTHIFKKVAVPILASKLNITNIQSNENDQNKQLNRNNQIMSPKLLGPKGLVNENCTIIRLETILNPQTMAEFFILK